jgi:hypothetical protein
MHCAKIPEMRDRDIAADQHPLTNRQWVEQAVAGIRKAGSERFGSGCAHSARAHLKVQAATVAS